MNVWVLHQQLGHAAAADESDVLVQVSAVAQSLQRLGHSVQIIECGLDLGALERSLTQARPDSVFNLVEGLGAHSRMSLAVALLLESLAIPFTGSGFLALSESTNKLATKRRLLAARLPTPELFCAGTSSGTFIVKSVWEHASVGLGADSVVSASEVPAALARKLRDGCGEFFAERYIPGRELNVAVWVSASGPRVLPMAEIDFSAYPEGRYPIVDYAAKWLPESQEYQGSTRRFLDEQDSALQARAAELALACFNEFGLSGYARVDLRVHEADPYIVDVNANPCLSPDAGFAAALERAGIAFDTAIFEILATARRLVAHDKFRDACN